MSNFDITYTHDQSESANTLAEYETALKAAVWDWFVEGDEAASNANLETIKSVEHIRDNLRWEIGGLKNNKPGSAKANIDVLQQIQDLHNSIAPRQYQYEDADIEYSRKGLKAGA